MDVCSVGCRDLIVWAFSSRSCTFILHCHTKAIPSTFSDWCSYVLYFVLYIHSEQLIPFYYILFVDRTDNFNEKFIFIYKNFNRNIFCRIISAYIYISRFFQIIKIAFNYLGPPVKSGGIYARTDWLHQSMVTPAECCCSMIGQYETRQFNLPDIPLAIPWRPVQSVRSWNPLKQQIDITVVHPKVVYGRWTTNAQGLINFN